MLYSLDIFHPPKKNIKTTKEILGLIVDEDQDKAKALLQ